MQQSRPQFGSQKEHEFICDEPNHPAQSVILLSAIGSAPDAPTCPVCAEVMRKVWSVPLVSYEMAWHHSQKNSR